MDRVSRQCSENHYWLLNLFFINNFLPNEKMGAFVSPRLSSTPLNGEAPITNMCLPQTWFISVYMQLSMLLPLYLFFFFWFPFRTKIFCLSLTVLMAIYKITRTLIIANQMSNAGLETTGLVNPARNVSFFTGVFSLPFEHFTAFVVFGAHAGLIFHFYFERRLTQEKGACKYFYQWIYERLW